MNEQIRIAIVNRDETAARLLHSTAANHENDIRSIALYTKQDRHALFVRRADEVLDLESIPASQPDSELSTYLDIPRLIRALKVCRAHMVWVGWGFVAENAAFAAACEEAG